MSDMYSQPKNPELVPQIYSLPEISAHSEIPNNETSVYKFAQKFWKMYDKLWTGNFGLNCQIHWIVEKLNY